MNKFLILILLFLNGLDAKAQIDTFTGTIPTNAKNSLFEKIATNEDFYYFGEWNLDNENSVNILQTNHNFELIRSIENLQIRGVNTSHLTYLEIINNRLMMLSSANINGDDKLYSHSLSLDLTDHIIIDSLDLKDGEEYVANEYKQLDSNGNMYAIGNISTGDLQSTLSANYIEFTKQGKFVRCEELDFRDTYNGNSLFATTFDYNPNTKQYFLGEPYISYLFDSTFSEVSVFPSAIPIQTNSSFFITALSGSCNFTSNERVECVSASRQAAQYTNFIVEYGIEDDSLFYVDAIALHPNINEELRARLVHVSRDDQENYYFSYHGPFSPQDGTASPNKVYISKFDKDLNEIFFLEFENDDEHFISENKLDDGNNLIVIGGITTPENPTVFQNFYIKVSENGQVLTNTIAPPNKNGIDVYPNPTDDIVFIEGVDPNIDATYTLFTLDGRLVYHGDLTNGIKRSINLADLSSGMYLLHIIDGTGISVEKVVKK